MFCSGCLKRLPSFVASGPSVLEALKRRELDAARARTSKAAVEPHAPALGFPLWLPAVLLAMCAAFLGWVASMTESGPARRHMVMAVPPEGLARAAPTRPSPSLAVDSASGASVVQGSAKAETTPAPMADEEPAGVAEADALDVVAGFYRALAAGDGRAAAGAVTPAKRDVPAFREERMSRFYGSLREPLAMESLRPIAENRFEAKYSYRAARTPCRATAMVDTEVIGQRTFIKGIRATC
jgi:hypothetical protein